MKASKEEALKLLEDMAILNGHSLRSIQDVVGLRTTCGCFGCGSSVYFSNQSDSTSTNGTLVGMAPLSKCTRDGNKKDWSQARENELIAHLRANYKGDFYG